MRAAGRAAAYSFRVLPEGLRFAAAVLAARALEPLIARTQAYRERQKLGTDDVRETSLQLLLMMLTRHGTTFAPPLRVLGAHHLPPPGSGPILVASPHTMLSMLFLRYLEDEGHAPFVVAEYPGLRIPGTTKPARVLSGSAGMLLRVRSIFREGGTIAAMIDRSYLQPDDIAVRPPDSHVFVSTALLEIAQKQGARIVFLATRLDASSRIVCSLSAPSRPRSSVAALASEFASFAQHVSSERTDTNETPGHTGWRM